MALDEEAKAAQEIAKASREAIQATREAGGFVARFIEGPLSLASEIVQDRLRYARWERQQRLMLRANEFLKEAGISEPSRPVPLSVAVPLLEAASLEEDDQLQDVWARLLVNAANAESGVEVRRTFVSILQDMGSFEVRILDAIINAPDDLPNKNFNGIPTAELPEGYASVGEMGWHPEPPDHIAIAVWNINRLGCIVPIMTTAGLSIRTVYPTPLGVALVRACTIQG